MSLPSGETPADIQPDERLESWKEVATYLNRSVTTVQRWEREERLPVHRLHHDAQGSVYALKRELEEWRSKRDKPSPVEELPDSTRIAAWSRSAVRIPRYALIICTLFGGTAIGLLAGRFATQSARTPVRRLTIVPADEAPIVLGTDRSLTITSDGSRIVYVGGPDGTRLFVRQLDQLEAAPIAGLSAPRHPFISPDGKWIAFFNRSTLEKVPITGGPPTVVFEGSSGLNGLSGAPDRSSGFTARRLGSRGGAWGPDNRIAFALEGRLLRISADGGAAEILSTPDPKKGEATYCWPEYLPDSVGLLFTILPTGDWGTKGERGAVENAKIAVLDLRTKQQKVLLEGGSHARYVSGGYLVYASGGSLKAVAFDLRKLAINGTPQTVVPGVATTIRGAAQFDVAQDGTLIYAPGAVENNLVTLVWVDKHGREETVGTPAFTYRHPRLSPDGSRIALDSYRDLGLWDFNSRTLSWFGIGPTSHTVWTPDGRRIIFGSSVGGPVQLSWLPIDGSQAAARLTDTNHEQFPNTVSPDGRYLVVREDGASPDLMVLDLKNSNKPQPLIQTPFRELNADFSPDGKFLTYQSNQSGQDEVYVEPFPNVGAKRWLISRGGGKQPVWGAGGLELFYLSPSNAMMSVPIQSRGSGFAMGVPTKLFENPSYMYGAGPVNGRSYDLSPKDGRFLIMKHVDTPASAQSDTVIEVVLNWLEELKQTVRH